MSDFKFLCPIVPFAATVTSSYTTLAGYGPQNTIGGSYGEGSRNSASSVLADVVYNLPSNYTVDFLVISNLGRIVLADSADIGVRLYYNDNTTFYGWTIDSTDLVGKNSFDLVTTVTSTSENYYRVRVGTTDSMKHELLKVFIGEAFDMGRDPLPIRTTDESLESGKRQTAREFTIIFEGVTGAKKTAFVEDVVSYCKATPIFLWDTQDRLFFGDELIYARLESFRCTPNTREVWRIETNWIESI